MLTQILNALSHLAGIFTAVRLWLAPPPPAPPVVVACPAPAVTIIIVLPPAIQPAEPGAACEGG